MDSARNTVPIMKWTTEKTGEQPAVRKILDEWNAYAIKLMSESEAGRLLHPHCDTGPFPCPRLLLETQSRQQTRTTAKDDLFDDQAGTAVISPEKIFQIPGPNQTSAEFCGNHTATQQRRITMAPKRGAPKPDTHMRKRARHEPEHEMTDLQSTSSISTSTASHLSSLTVSMPVAASLADLSLTELRNSSPASPVARKGPLVTNEGRKDQSASLTRDLPAWYMLAEKPMHPKAHERAMWDDLKTLGDLIKALPAIQKSPLHIAAKINTIYAEIDKLRFMDVSPFGLRRAKLLDEDHGLPQIFNTKTGIIFPTYVITDARALYIKWSKRILDGSNIFRGILNMAKEKGTNGRAPSIDKAHKIDWRFFGEGHLVNGDWLANQLCAVRDGAHGSTQGGISGIAGHGATSISMSGDRYTGTDKDKLNEIWYAGTVQNKGGEAKTTTNTDLLIKSQETRRSVRVLRSMNLPKSNPYKPQRGLRYDGLYTVEEYACIDQVKQNFLFRLVRCPGQDPVRYSGLQKRPTKMEMHRFDSEMRNFGKKEVCKEGQRDVT